MISKGFLLRPFNSETKYYSIHQRADRQLAVLWEKKLLPQNCSPTEMYCWSQK